jgi:hypothetical protein
VNTALQEALGANDIESPYPIQTVSLQVEPEVVDRLSRGWGEHGGVQ